MKKGDRLFQFQKALKRLIDILLSTIGLLLLSPVILVFMILVKLDSPGGIFSRHKRVGMDGREFDLIKFRTLRKGGDDSGYLNYLSDLIQSERNGSSKGLPQAKLADRVRSFGELPRVTRLGRFIRGLGLDEIPLLFNVLMGEMSLVGPRPHVQFEVANYTAVQRHRLSVRPGITGSWQVDSRANCTFSELIALDLEYINHWSLGVDIQILFKTLILAFEGGEGFWTRQQKAIPAPIHKLPGTRPTSYDPALVRPLEGGLSRLSATVPITGNKTEDCADPSEAAPSKDPETNTTALSSLENSGSDGNLP